MSEKCECVRVSGCLMTCEPCRKEAEQKLEWDLLRAQLAEARAENARLREDFRYTARIAHENVKGIPCDCGDLPCRRCRTLMALKQFAEARVTP